MSRLFYPLPIHLDSRRLFLIWYSDETDGLLLDDHGTLLRFESEASLRTHAGERGMPIEDGEAVWHDLSHIARLLHSQRNQRLDCVKVLEAWNLFADLAASLPARARRFRRLDALATREYMKVFAGNNLPAISPEGHHYEPCWAAWERRKVRRLLRSGLALLRSELRRAAA